MGYKLGPRSFISRCAILWSIQWRTSISSLTLMWVRERSNGESGFIYLPPPYCHRSAIYRRVLGGVHDYRMSVSHFPRCHIWATCVSRFTILIFCAWTVSLISMIASWLLLISLQVKQMPPKARSVRRVFRLIENEMDLLAFALSCIASFSFSCLSPLCSWDSSLISSAGWVIENLSEHKPRRYLFPF